MMIFAILHRLAGNFLAIQRSMQSPHLVSLRLNRSGHQQGTCDFVGHQHPCRTQGPGVHPVDTAEAISRSLLRGNLRHIHQQPHLHQLSWLLEGSTDLDPPSVEVLLSQCLQPLVKKRVRKVHQGVLFLNRDPDYDTLSLPD
jgi:hypothetical protein